VVLQLVHDPNMPRWFTYELLSHDSRTMAILGPADINELGAGISTWGDVDAFACYVAGPSWREGRLETNDIQRWAASQDRWWRRAALVSTVPLNSTARGGRGDMARTVAICDLLKHDRDAMVVKALSWALRELAKKDKRHVEAYLRKHATELAPRVVREVRNKLATGLKNPRRPRAGA
jgi:3-methyladenine DNA glycosylase AlkD